MSGVPGFRLRGVHLALDAIDKTQTILRAEADKLAALFGDDSPAVNRLRGHTIYLRNIFDLVTEDVAVAESETHKPSPDHPSEIPVE